MYLTKSGGIFMIINPLRSPIELAVFKLNVKRKIIRDKMFLKS